MKIFIYSNCQGAGVEAFLPLLTNREFTFRRVENYRVINGEISVDTFLDDLKTSDLLIYQPVGSNHGFLSTTPGEDNIRSAVRQGAQAISVPYVYNDALWPCFVEGESVRNGEAIDVLLEAGATDEDVQQAYDRGEMDFRFAERMALSLDTLRQREADTDVKMHAMVAEQLLSTELLFTQNHPSSVIFREMTSQICRLLWGDTFQTRDIGLVDNNLAALPGRYPLDRYSIEQLGVTFQAAPDEGADHFYRAILKTHCANWRASQAQLRKLA